MPARRRNHLEVVWMPGLSINLILAAITYYTALSSALFWCNLGTFGTIGQSCPFAKRASTIFLGFFKRRDALLADRAGAVQP